MVAAIDPFVGQLGGNMAIATETESRCTRPDERGRPCYYTPSRIFALLRLYHYLHDRMPPKHRELRVFVQRARLHGAKWERAAIKRADINTALASLPPLAAYIVEQTCIENRPLRGIGGHFDVVRIYGRPISHMTVSRMRRDAIWNMAYFLGTCAECRKERVGVEGRMA